MGRPAVRRRVGRRRRDARRCSTRRSGTRSPTSVPSSTPTATASKRPSTTTGTAPGSTSSARSPTRGRRRRCTAASPATSAWSTWRSTACRVVASSSTWLTTSATTGVGSTSKTLEEIMAADGVVVEPGDMLLLHTGFATKVLEWNRDPDPVKIHTMCAYLDARDESLLRVDHRLADLGAGRGQLRGRRAARQGSRSEPAFVPAHPPPLPVQARRAARGDVVPARTRRLVARAPPEPLLAHRAPAAPPRRGRVSAYASRDRLMRSGVRYFGYPKYVTPERTARSRSRRPWRAR